MAASIRQPALAVGATILLGLALGAAVLGFGHRGTGARGRVVHLRLDGGTGRLAVGADGAIRLDRGSAPTEAIGSRDRLVVDGRAATLMIDFRSGNPIPAGGVAFVGVAGSVDRLVLGAGSFDAVRHAVTGVDRGRFVLRGGSSRSVIDYAGVAGVADRTTSLDRTLALERNEEAVHRTLHELSDGRIMLGSRGAGSETFAPPGRSLFLDVHSPLTVGALSMDAALRLGVHSPFTFAVNFTAAGPITATAGETNDAPACNDDLTVNPGVTVQSTGGSVTLNAGDDFINNGTVIAATAVNVTAGSGDVDGCGAVVHTGSLQGPTVNVNAIQNICVDAIGQASAAVTLSTTGGAIVDCNDPPAGTQNVTGSSLVFSASTGVGTGAGGAIETAVGNVEGTTATGGIDLADADALTIGGVTSSKSGLAVSTSGPLHIAAGGTIGLSDTDGLQSVSDASGAVTLEANGASSDITDTVDNDAINAAGGSVTLTAGRDILLGTAGSLFDNDVRGSGAVTFSAGRDVVVDGFSDVASDDFGTNTGGDVTATAGRDVDIANNHGNDASIGSSGSGGADTIVHATNAFNLTAPSSAALFSNSGRVTVNANTMSLTSGSGITASIGDIKLNAGDGLTLPTNVVHTPGQLKASIDSPDTDPGTGEAFTLTGALDVGSAVVNGGPDGDTFQISADPTVPLSLNGRGGADQFNGGGGAEVMRGGTGADHLTGGAGADTLRGGRGNDTLNAVDGAGGDLVDGDAGTDACTADPGDTVRSCEA